MKAPQMYGLAIAVLLTVHLVWIAWVVFGAVWTRNRPLLAAFHIASLVWGLVMELGPWPCPLTVAEQLFETGVGSDLYRGGVLIHYLDAIVYPDFPEVLLISLGVVVCAINLAVYGRRYCQRILA